MRRFRSLSSSAGVPVRTMHRAIHRGDLQSESRRIKPLLTSQNRIDRVKWCLSHVNLHHSQLSFYSMYNRVHLDKKWFYVMHLHGWTITVPREVIDETSLKIKRFLTKIKFLVAVAVPRYKHHRKSSFDGKIGIWTFLEKVVAKRTSKNSSKGTLVTDTANADKKLYYKFLTDKVFPAIRTRFPNGKRRIVQILKENAKPHGSINDLIVQGEARKEGWKMKIVNQPANSADLNVLDL